MPTLTRVDRLYALALCAALCGCASIAPIPYADVASSSAMVPNASDPSGRMPYRYTSAVDWRGYTKAIVEPVVIYNGADQQFGDISEADKASLARTMQIQFTEKLATRFSITEQRGPNTLRVRLTLTGAIRTTPVLGTLSRIDIGGLVYNGVQAARDGEGSMTGSVTYAVEIFDAATSRLLTAFVTKQYPKPTNFKATIGPLTAAETGIDQGANALLAAMR